ncbi:hypothetical protein OAT16_03375 [Prolixibacteraceae bacterium]|nr:hypothetical protein [Prolixibacteraceae bacterium]
MNSFMSSGYRAVFTPTPQRILISYYLGSSSHDSTPALYGEIKEISNLISPSFFQCSLTSVNNEEILRIHSHSNLFTYKWELYDKNNTLIGTVLINRNNTSIIGYVDCNNYGKLGRIQYAKFHNSCVITKDDQTFGCIDFVESNQYLFHLDGSIKSKTYPALLFLGLSAIIYTVQNSPLIPIS